MRRYNLGEKVKQYKTVPTQLEERFDLAFEDYLKNPHPMTNTEIAFAVGCTPQYISNIYHRAIVKLYDKFDKSWLIEE